MMRSAHSAEDASLRGPQRTSSNVMIVGASAAIGLLVGIAAVVMLFAEDDQAGHSSPTVAMELPRPVAPAPAPVIAAPPPTGSRADEPHDAAATRPAPAPIAPQQTTAARRLAEARALIDTSLSRYDEAAAALRSIVSDFPSSPEAPRAREIVAELDARHASIAEEALLDARSASNRLVRERRYDEARSVLRMIDARFGGSTWHRTSGRAQVADAIATVDRREQEEQSLREQPLRPELVGSRDAAIINDFESAEDLKMFSASKGTIAPAREHVTHGTGSMRVDAGSYLGGWSIVEVRGDWSGFDTLQVDIYNDTGSRARVSIRIWDGASETGDDRTYWNRHNSAQQLSPGANVVTLDLHDLYRGEKGRRNTVTNRNIDINDIRRFDLGFTGKQGAFYVDTMRLVRTSR